MLPLRAARPDPQSGPRLGSGSPRWSCLPAEHPGSEHTGVSRASMVEPALQVCPGPRGSQEEGFLRKNRGSPG